MEQIKPTTAPQPVSPKKDITMIYVSIAALVMAGLGMLAGFGIYKYSTGDFAATSKSSGQSENVSSEQFTNGADAEGVLVKGSAGGEGTHKLERGMGADKDVYLLSTVLDLDSFVGKKVQIWGNTLSSQEAGWLMDVGRVKIIE